VSLKLELSTSLVHIFDRPVMREEAIGALASLLQTHGYVRETFAQAVLEREKVFPTGLPTQPIGIAIPHTDAEHVKRAALAVGILPQPVQFEEMGSPGTFVDVSVIVVLAIPDPKAVMPVLRQLAGSFQNREFLQGLQAARDQSTVLDLVAGTIPDAVARV